LYCDENGTIFVADWNNHRVTILTHWSLCCRWLNCDDWLTATWIVSLDWYLFLFFCFVWVSCNYD
jgi:hypothetical protein